MLHLLQLSSILLQGVAQASGSGEVELYFWIDAICINQADLGEKSRQVPRMGQIYSSAFMTLMWLGSFEENLPFIEAAVGFQLLLEALHNFSPLEVFSRPQLAFDYGQDMLILDSSEKAQMMVATYGKMMTNDYFKRVWVIQEYFLSHRNPCAIIGLALFSLDSVLVFGENLEQFIFHPDESIREGAGTRARMVKSLYRNALGPELLRTKVLTQDFQQKSLAQQLLYLKTNFGTKYSRIAHDQVYGMLGMLNNERLPERLRVDYSKPYEHVFRAFSELIIEETNDLRLLMFSESSELEGQPSWVIDFRRTTPWPAEPVIPHMGHFIPDSDTLVVEGVQTGSVVSYFPDGQYPARTAMLQFHDTVVAAAASIKDQDLPTTWRKWFGVFLESYCAQPSDHGEQFLTAAHFVYDQLYEENKVADPGFDRSLVLDLFDTFRFCLVSDGTIAMCNRRLPYDDPENHLVYMFKGSTQRSIISTDDGQDYRYIGWMIEQGFPFNEKELLSEPGTKIHLV